MGSNPDLKTRSPLKKGATTLFCFLTGRKRMTKKRYYYSTDIKRNFVPSKRIYLSKFVSSQLFILAAKSCAELLDAGFTNNGVYKILFNNSQVFDVYCDQSSRGGGNFKKIIYLIMHDRIWRPMRLKKRSVLFHRHLLAQFWVDYRKSSWISFILLYFSAWLVLRSYATFSTNQIQN